VSESEVLSVEEIVAVRVVEEVGVIDVEFVWELKLDADLENVWLRD
jgi:hypothetical protein